MKKRSMLGARSLSSLKLFLVSTLVAFGILATPAGMASATAPLWSDPINLSPATTNIQNQDPMVAMSDDGQVQIAVWLNQDSSPSALQESHTLDSGTTWSSPANVGSAPAECAPSETGVDVYGLCSPDVAMNSDGTVTTVVWIYNDAIQAGTIDLTVVNPSWTMNQISSSDERVFEPQISMSNDGQIQTAVWRWEDHSSTPSTPYAVEIQATTSVSAGQSWQSELTLDSGTYLGSGTPRNRGLIQPAISVSGDGSTMTATWVNYLNGDGTAQIFGAKQSVSGSILSSWNQIMYDDDINFSPWGHLSLYPQVAISDDGLIQTVSWQDDTEHIVHAISTVNSWNGCTNTSDCSERQISNYLESVYDENVYNPGPQLAMSSNGSHQTVTFAQSLNGDSGICIHQGVPQYSFPYVLWGTSPGCRVANFEFPFVATSGGGQTQTVSLIQEGTTPNEFPPFAISTADSWVNEDVQQVSQLADGPLTSRSPKVAISQDGSHQTMIWVLESGVVQVVMTPYTPSPTPSPSPTQPSPGPTPTTTPAPELASTGFNIDRFIGAAFGACAIGFVALAGASYLRRKKN